MTPKRLIAWLFFLALLAAALVMPVGEVFATNCEKGVCTISEQELNGMLNRIGNLTEELRGARRAKHDCEVMRRGA